MPELYPGEFPQLVREHGYAKAYRIVMERRNKPPEEETQGDSSEDDEATWKARIEANKRKST